MNDKKVDTKNSSSIKATTRLNKLTEKANYRNSTSVISNFGALPLSISAQPRFSESLNGNVKWHVNAAAIAAATAETDSPAASHSQFTLKNVFMPW
ncbi:hypothetical protein HK096_000469, partial [Nowakowskiella sp. JEL0078]